MNFSLLKFSDSTHDKSIVTPWSFVHFISGAVIYLYTKFFFKNISNKNAFIVVLVVHTLYEIKDLFYYFRLTGRSEWMDNSLLNSVGDTFFAMFGFCLATQFKKVTLGDLLTITFIYLVTMYLFIINNYG
jgi:hypothetical protein